MSTRALRTKAQLLNISIAHTSSLRRFYSKKVIQENDIVLLQRKGFSKGLKRIISDPLLSKPLVPDKKVFIPSSRDDISTNNIIGKGLRDVVYSRVKGTQYRICEPSLGEYTNLSPRIVTPIYPQDANLIVSLLDLHPTVPSSHGVFDSLSPEYTKEGEPLEIFEAGTGHGALTLHLARAIHGANTRPPEPFGKRDPPKEEELPGAVAMGLDIVKMYSSSRSRFPAKNVEVADKVYEQCLADYIHLAGELGARVEFSILAKDEKYSSAVRENFRQLAEGEMPMPQQNSEIFDKLYMSELDKWRAKRRAVVHTLDNSDVHSKHARGVVRNFRRGMYFHEVDFHVGTIEGYLQPRLEESGEEPFLNHAILDLPDTHTYLEIVSKSMKPNGSLVTWNPSITQVVKCVDIVREKKLPFLLERVLEMGVAGGTGGREWDVRRIRIREKAARPVAEEPASLEESPGTSNEELPNSTSLDSEVEIGPEEPNPEGEGRYEMVCRPKVGIRVEGGGFVGLWRRMEHK